MAQSKHVPSMNEAHAAPWSFFSFLSILETATYLVQQVHPEAQLYEADGMPPHGQGRTAHDVNRWRFVFNDPSTRPNSTVILFYEDGTYGNPLYIDQPWLEDRVIDLPLTMDLDHAVKLLREHYASAFSAVTLRYPLYPGVQHPSYIFTLIDPPIHVFIGIGDHRVSSDSGMQ